MAASQSAPPSTVQAIGLLLDRLNALALEPAVEARDARSTLLDVPEEKRDNVLAVLGELAGRERFEDLAQGARLVLNAASELWREQGEAPESSRETEPTEAEASAGLGETVDSVK